MIHLLALVLCLAAFTALAFAMRRQQRDLLGRSLRWPVTYGVRTLGACALIAVLGILVATHGWSIGLVMFSGHTSIAAGIVYAVLVGHAGKQPRTLRHR